MKNHNQDGEIWKDINGYESIYMISNYGKIKSNQRAVIECNGKSRTLYSRILRQTLNTKNGYFYVTLYRDKIGTTFSIHRLVALHFHEINALKPHVNHKDGNKQNNHYLNLEWVTRSENQKHAVKLGLLIPTKVRARGERISNLKNNDIIDIRMSKLTQRELGIKYNIAQTAISCIKLKKTWKHI